MAGLEKTFPFSNCGELKIFEKYCLIIFILEKFKNVAISIFI